MRTSLSIEQWNLPPPPDSYTGSGYVDLLGNPDDYHVVLLASMGMTYSTIARRTGLSHGQIAYRLAKVNKQLKADDKLTAYNYRNGKSKASKAVIMLASRKVASIIQPTMRRALVIDV